MGPQWGRSRSGRGAGRGGECGEPPAPSGVQYRAAGSGQPWAEIGPPATVGERGCSVWLGARRVCSASDVGEAEIRGGEIDLQQGCHGN